jgi:sialate O-acetylesterase
VGNLYEAHIRPFVGYGIRGVLWDQGESGTAIEGVDQYTLMGALIRGWRNAWGQGEFPFIYIQKPSGGGCAWDGKNPVTDKGEKFSPLPPTVPADGNYVENHIRIINYPNTAMAISSDLGPGIHPSNKSGYGHRACDVALGMVYGKKVEYYGPKYESHRIEGNKVRVKFTHVGQGLAFKHGDKLQGFALADADKKFQWADAKIDGDTVVVSAAAVVKPVFVRYAWSGKRTWANLFNKDGLPAIPFRTDDDNK